MQREISCTGYGPETIISVIFGEGSGSLNRFYRDGSLLVTNVVQMDAGITIIGAGVIGLAIAEEVSTRNRNVFMD